MSRFVDEPQQPEAPQKPKKMQTRRADPFYIWMLVLIAIVALLTVAVTSFFAASSQYAASSNPTGGVSSEVLSSLPSTFSQEQQTASAPADTSSAASSIGVSSQDTVSGSASSEAGASSEQVSSDVVNSAPAVDHTKADQFFAQNVIDSEKENGLNEAASTAAIVKVYEDGIGRWKTAVNDMVNRIDRLTDTDALKQQAAWADDAAKQIDEQKKNLTEDSGTAKQLEIAEFTYELYRTRAQELYRQLYRLDPDFRL